MPIAGMLGNLFLTDLDCGPLVRIVRRFWLAANIHGCNYYLIRIIGKPGTPPGKGAVRNDVVFALAHQVYVTVAGPLGVVL